MNLIKYCVLLFCAISSLRNRYVTGQNRLAKFAPFVEYLIKQKADIVVESERNKTRIIK